MATWTTHVTEDSDGFHAVVTSPDGETVLTCTHRHGTEHSADSCAGWEARAREKGQSRWDAQGKRGRSAPTFDGLRVASLSSERATDEEAAKSHEYVPSKDLVTLWHAVVTGATKRPAANLLFIGPQGSGKTDGARYLAALVGLPFTKVDAASMTDPEGWFGTREIVVQDGVAITDYRPSVFVEALQRPGVLLIDEANRVRDEHRNVLIPVLDASRSVLNPLTGDVIHRHPQCFIIMSGNVGLQFTGTNAMDPAFWSRSLKVEFDYTDESIETRVVAEASGCSPEDAAVLVRFANETRAKAKSDPEFAPISTREAIEAGRLIADGLDRDGAVKFAIVYGASSEGGASSLRADLEKIWAGVRMWRPDPKATGSIASVVLDDAAARSSWVCPSHGQAKIVPAGVSQKTGKAYKSFRACPVYGCPHTEDRDSMNSAGGATGHAVTSAQGTQNARACASCGSVNPVGRNAFCTSCGASL